MPCERGMSSFTVELLLPLRTKVDLKAAFGSPFDRLQSKLMGDLGYAPDK